MLTAQAHRLLTRRPQRTGSRMLALWIGAVLAIVAGTGRAEAHAIVVQTDPADGATLSAAPKLIRVWFSEPVVPNLTKLWLVDSTGQSIPVTFTEDLAGAPLGPTQQVVLDVAVPHLAPGAYRLTWQTVSNTDLHATSGALVFGVQATPVMGPAETERAPSPLEVLFHWIDLACLAALTGAVALAAQSARLDRRGLPIQTIEQTRRRLLTLAAWACVVGALGGVGRLVVQRADLGDSWGEIVLATRFGQLWLAHELLLGLAAAGAMVQVRWPRRVRLAGLGLGVLALAALEILSTHITDLYGFSWLRLAAGCVHLLGAGLWAGGVAALAVSCWPLLRRGPAERAVAQALLRGFGWLALGSVGVLGVTGLFLSGQLVASVDAWLQTLYGQTLLVKIGLVLATGLVGLLNSAALHETLARAIGGVLRRPLGWAPFGVGRLRQTLMLEVVLASGVMFLTAVLGAAQPARGPQWDPSTGPNVVPGEISASAGDLLVTLSVKPDRPGQNFVAVGVYDTRRPAPAPIDKVLVRFGRPDGGGALLTAVADSLGSGHYQVTGSMIDAAGNWQLEVVVQRPGLSDAHLATGWTVLPPASALTPRPVLVSNTPLAPVMSLTALGLGTILTLGWAALWLLRRGRAGRVGGDAAAAVR
jgi:copper transport protein